MESSVEAFRKLLRDRIAAAKVRLAAVRAAYVTPDWSVRQAENVLREKSAIGELETVLEAFNQHFPE